RSLVGEVQAMPLYGHNGDVVAAGVDGEKEPAIVRCDERVLRIQRQWARTGTAEPYGQRSRAATQSSGRILASPSQHSILVAIKFDNDVTIGLIVHDVDGAASRFTAFSVLRRCDAGVNHQG